MRDMYISLLWKLFSQFFMQQDYLHDENRCHTYMQPPFCSYISCTCKARKSRTINLVSQHSIIIIFSSWRRLCLVKIKRRWIIIKHLESNRASKKQSSCRICTCKSTTESALLRVCMCMHIMFLSIHGRQARSGGESGERWIDQVWKDVTSLFLLSPTCSLQPDCFSAAFVLYLLYFTWIGVYLFLHQEKTDSLSESSFVVLGACK